MDKSQSLNPGGEAPAAVAVGIANSPADDGFWKMAKGMYVFMFITMICSFLAMVRAVAMTSDMKGIQSNMDEVVTDTAQMKSGLTQVTSQGDSYTAEIEANSKAATDLHSSIDSLYTATAGGSNGCSEKEGVIPGGPMSQYTIAGQVHYYQLVTVGTHILGDYDTGITWVEAEWDAAQRCYSGNRGHLATITEAGEQSVINNLMPTGSVDGTTDPFHNYVAWIGASDLSYEGHWEWANGPEKGTEFYTGENNVDGVPTPGMYNNWYCSLDTTSSWPYCEPNGGTSQDCLAVYGNNPNSECSDPAAGTSNLPCGTWTDKGCDNFRTDWYIVEYSP